MIGMDDILEKEKELIKQRYEKRDFLRTEQHSRYSPISPCNYISACEKYALLAQTLGLIFKDDFRSKKYLDIGCGNGGNLTILNSMGVEPNCLYGNDIMPNRIEEAKKRLPTLAHLDCNNFLEIPYQENFFDCIFLYTVLSSILDLDFQKALIQKAKSLLKPGGVIIIYDFIYNNPANPDVRRIDIGFLKKTFIPLSYSIKKATIIPPIARKFNKFPIILRLMSLFSFLKSHRFIYLQK